LEKLDGVKEIRQYLFIADIVVAGENDAEEITA
jgi:hypothetical protein